jgi:hypothetical protein
MHRPNWSPVRVKREERRRSVPVRFAADCGSASAASRVPSADLMHADASRYLRAIGLAQ